MTVKISSLEIENVKRVKAVYLEPSAKGLTIIGGRNGQGKTSVLDAIAWNLGGDRLKPSNPMREGSVVPPAIHMELTNGFIVERKGKNSALKVYDPEGQKGGQQLLNEFIDQFALDLPKFLSAGNKEKAQILLQIIGIGEQLAIIESKELKYFNQRTQIGVIAKRKKAHAEELEYYPDVPEEPLSASQLIQSQQAILAKNGENQRQRAGLADLKKKDEALQAEIKRLKEQYDTCMADHQNLLAAITNATKTVAQLQDESTDELERSIADMDAINVKVRANADKARAQQEAEELESQYKELTGAIEEARKEKMALLNAADLPLPGLSVNDDELTYKGSKWDCMSSSEQLKVATAIVRKLNPNCGFVLMDKLEQMDRETLAEFGSWLEEENLQVIATRVSTDSECSIIIEDGYVKNAEVDEPAKKDKPAPKWQAGKF